MRIGLDCARKLVLAECHSRSIPIIISANSLWNNKKKEFRSFAGYYGHDIALDSGGFVAMKLHGGYRFSDVQYAALAKSLAPAWWAQMDHCCEPEVATNREEVRRRIAATAKNLSELRAIARGEGQPLPMPVLQGWMPADYVYGPIYNDAAWPDLVGVGSVCRRSMKGESGLLAVLRAIVHAIPKHVKLHLFGVKSAAIAPALSEVGDRIASFDSQAWAFRVRVKCREAGVSCDSSARALGMVEWVSDQRQALERPIQCRLI